jgi:hypothetical protein
MEIRAMMEREKIEIVEAADTGVPAAAAVYGTQAVDAREGLFENLGVIVEVLTVSAASPLW